MEITADLLLQAYRIGVFPMGERRDDPKLHWLDPRQRAILPLDAFHLSHRLARTVRSGRFEVTADTAFAETATATASSAGSTAGWSAGCTASRSARRSSARACSAASATPRRWRSSISRRG